MIRREDYVRELQQGLLLLADQLARLKGGDKGRDTAAAFAGFAAEGEYGDYADEPPEKIDLEQFGGAWPLLIMYDFAVGLMGVGSIDDYEDDALKAFIDLVPRTGSDGMPVAWADDPVAVQVLDMCRARQKLSDERLRSKAVFSVRELALLADMSEGAVRNALSAKELASHRKDGKVVVGWSETAAWLRKKKGFKPTPEAPSLHHIAIETASTLKDLLAVLMSLPDAGGILPGDWRSGRWSGNLGEVQVVARALGIDPERLAVHMSQLWVREQP